MSSSSTHSTPSDRSTASGDESPESDDELDSQLERSALISDSKETEEEDEEEDEDEDRQIQELTTKKRKKKTILLEEDDDYEEDDGSRQSSDSGQSAEQTNTMTTGQATEAIHPSSSVIVVQKPRTTKSKTVKASPEPVPGKAAPKPTLTQAPPKPASIKTAPKPASIKTAPKPASAKAAPKPERIKTLSKPAHVQSQPQASSSAKVQPKLESANPAPKRKALSNSNQKPSKKTKKTKKKIDPAFDEMDDSACMDALNEVEKASTRAALDSQFVPFEHKGPSHCAKGLPYPNVPSTQEKMLEHHPELLHLSNQFKLYTKNQVTVAVLISNIRALKIMVETIPQTDDDIFGLVMNSGMLKGWGGVHDDPIFALPAPINPTSGTSLTILNYNKKLMAGRIEADHVFIREDYLNPEESICFVRRKGFIEAINRADPSHALIMYRECGDRQRLYMQLVHPKGSTGDILELSLSLLTQPAQYDNNVLSKSPILNARLGTHAMIRLDPNCVRPMVSKTMNDRNGKKGNKHKRKTPDGESSAPGDEEEKPREDVESSLVMWQLFKDASGENWKLTMTIGDGTNRIGSEMTSVWQLKPWHGASIGAVFQEDTNSTKFLSLTQNVVTMNSNQVASSSSAASAGFQGVPSMDALRALNEGPAESEIDDKSASLQNMKAVACAIFHTDIVAEVFTSTRLSVPMPAPVIMLELHQLPPHKGSAMDRSVVHIQQFQDPDSQCSFTLLNTIPQVTATQELMAILPNPSEVKPMFGGNLTDILNMKE
jgi:chemotaxis protein histidine kinase CheA